MAASTRHIIIGGLIAMGVDSTEEYLLTVSHSGRGLFSLETLEKIARSEETIYPENGFIGGIGSVSSETIRVIERNETIDVIELELPDKNLVLTGEADSITVKTSSNNPAR